jgi:hypothetical protein
MLECEGRVGGGWGGCGGGGKGGGLEVKDEEAIEGV